MSSQELLQITAPVLGLLSLPHTNTQSTPCADGPRCERDGRGDVGRLAGPKDPREVQLMHAHEPSDVCVCVCACVECAESNVWWESL